MNATDLFDLIRYVILRVLKSINIRRPTQNAIMFHEYVRKSFYPDKRSVKTKKLQLRSRSLVTLFTIYLFSLPIMNPRGSLAPFCTLFTFTFFSRMPACHYKNYFGPIAIHLTRSLSCPSFCVETCSQHV